MIVEAFRKIHLDGERKICANCKYYNYEQRYCIRYNQVKNPGEKQMEYRERGQTYYCDFVPIGGVR